MAKSRRVIRKVERSEVVGFDDHMWPVNLALLVLTGFVAGIIIAAGGFEDPRLLHNGWVRLATLGISIGVLLWSAVKFDRRMGRRLQLAVLVSLILHVGLAVYLSDKYLELMAQREAETAELVEHQEIRTQPEYHMTAPDQPTAAQDFENPVATKELQIESDQPQREATSPKDTAALEQPERMPDPEPDTRPSPVKLQRQQMSAPRRSEDTSKLSKQSELAQRQPQVPINAPEQRPTEQPAAPELTSQTAPVERQQAAVNVPKPSSSEPQTVTPQQTVRQASRAERPEPLAQASSTPTLKRNIAQPAQVPRAEAAREIAAQAAQATKPQELSPQAMVLDRSRAASPETAKEQSEPTPERPTTVAAATTPRQQPAEARPTLAQTEKSVAGKQAVEAAIASEAQSAPANVAAQQSAPAAQPGPASSDVARQAAQVPRKSDAQSEPVESPRSDSVARAVANRATPAPSPSLSPTAAPSSQPRRTQETSALAASPVAVDSPAMAKAASQDRPTARPATSALSKARSGFVGRGRSENADVAMTATPRNTAPIAAAAARREVATQTQAGPALSPSAPARIAKAKAGGEAPLATLEAEDVEAADTAGSRRPAEVSVAASAALQRSDASAAIGTVSAAVGHLEVDTGATQVVPDVGSGRAAGGGQPEIALNPQSESIARARPGGARLAAIVADTVKPTAEAPTDNGGGSPPALQANVQAADTGQRSPAGAPTARAERPAGASGAETGSSEAQVTQPSLARAGSTEALPGVKAGGGTLEPARGQGRVVVALLKADAVPQIDATPHTGGAPQGEPLDAQGAEVGRTGSGLPGKIEASAVGVAAGELPLDAPSAGEPGAGVALAKATGGAESGPAIASGSEGAPLKKGNFASLPGSEAREIDEPELAVSAPATQKIEAPPASLPASEDLPPRAGGSLPVRVVAAVGPGGLGQEFSAEVGLPSRRAQRDSAIVHKVPDKYLQKKVGGAPVLSGTAKDEFNPFARRDRRQQQATGGGQTGPSAKTEAAIESGLDFLARHQSLDGSWSFHNFGGGRRGYEAEQASIQSDTAATGLALLAYLGAGYDHFDDRFQHRVKAALNFLIKNQQPNGDLYVPQDYESNQVVHLYSHGIASIALCEAYGMTGDPELGDAAQKAIDFIVQSQHAERGGWRYTPGYMSDVSVTGWQLMALKSGELAGLKVPQKTYDRVIEFLDKSNGAEGDGSTYVYNPYAADTAERRHGRNPSTVMTAVGLLMRLYTGWNRDHPDMRRGADHLLANLPRYGTSTTPARVGTFGNPMRDTYYWYYATQVMFHMQGKYWKEWNERLHPMLVESQIGAGVMAGSWDPRGPIADKWGPQGGRIYITTMNLLSLEVYYRHLPIYESTAQ